METFLPLLIILFLVILPLVRAAKAGGGGQAVSESEKAK